MNMYLIPANSKKGQLIFNIFRWFDLLLLLMGAFFTVVFMFILPGDNIIMLAIKLLPLGLAILLVMPMPYYHNVLVFLQEAVIFLTSQRQYNWKGWCATYGIDEQSKN